MKKKAILAAESLGATNYNDLPYHLVIRMASDPAFANSALKKPKTVLMVKKKNGQLLMLTCRRTRIFCGLEHSAQT